MSILDNPAIVGLIVAIPSFLLGYLGYIRSSKADKIAEKSGAASAQITGVAQVIDGLNKLIDNLQDDNTTLRQSVSDLSIRLKEITAENSVLIRQTNSLKRKYVDKHL